MNLNALGLAHTSWTHYQYSILGTEINDDVEYILVQILIGKTKWYILGLYRPNGDVKKFLDTIESITNNIDSERLIIAGDMNLNVLEEQDNDVKCYFDLLDTINMAITNKIVTRKNYFSSSGTIIDHVIVSKSQDTLLTLTSNQIQLMSDHNFILLVMKTLNESPKKKKSIKIRRMNEFAIIREVNDCITNLPIDISNCSANVYFNAVHDIILMSVERNTTIKSIKLPSQDKVLPRWANDNYVSMLHSLHNLEEKIYKLEARNLPCEKLRTKYNELDVIRENYGSIISKKFYRSLQIEDLYSAWKTINEIAGKVKKYSSEILKDTNGELIFEPIEIATALQRKFLSIVGSCNSSHALVHHKYIGALVCQTFCFEDITPFTIFVQIGSLDGRKAVGYDNITARVLKGINETTSSHLANIFNYMVRTGIYIDRLKQSIIVPIHKGGDMTDIENKRPISLLSLLDKIFEGIIYDQISQFLESNKILDSKQYGFRSGRGCQEAIANILHFISRSLDRNLPVLLISFDISKAFDSINHELLIRKLNFIGIRGTANDLIKSFLSGRTQIVRYGNAYSDAGEIRLGVPQGANLGPLLFNLMLNDLANVKTQSTLIKYADDLVLMFQLDPSNNTQDTCNILKEDINEIMEYYHSNDLKINCIKSKFMIFGKAASSEIEGYLASLLFEKCDMITYLGLIIDKELKFGCLVDKLSRMMAQGIYVLRTLKSSLLPDALMKFYYGHIHSHLSYCAFSLLRCRSNDIHRLQILQNKALKLIFGLPDLFSTQELFTTYAKKVMPVAGIIYYSSLVLVKKCLLSTDDSLPKFERLRSARRYEIRLCNPKKKVLENDLSYDGCKLFNQLPTNIKQEKNIFLFKSQLKSFILEHNLSLVKPGQFASRNFFL